jgi:hypothetical protein
MNNAACKTRRSDLAYDDTAPEEDIPPSRHAVPRVETGLRIVRLATSAGGRARVVACYVRR